MKNDLLKQISEKMPTFSKRQKAVASYILKHYDRVAYLTAAKLAAATDVSESTVVRFAIELGYKGYPELQSAARAMVYTHLTSYQRLELSDSIVGDGDVVAKVLESDAEKITRTMDKIDRAAFSQAVDQLMNARTIYILGLRSSATLASFFSYQIRIIRGNVRLVQSTADVEMIEKMLGIGEGDVAIAFSFPRYAKRMIPAVKYAHDCGANVISVTDKEVSPIAEFADQLLLAESDMASFMDSLVAPLAIINALITELSRRMKPDLTERLRALEEIWEHYDVYDNK